MQEPSKPVADETRTGDSEPSTLQSQPQTSSPSTGGSAPTKKSTKLRIVALAAALGGIIFGGTVEYFVGGALDSTGWFGPTLDNIVNEQKANFDDIRAKLDALNNAAPGSPEAAKLQSELNALLATQEKLTDRTHMELATLHEEVTRLRAQVLEENGTSSGADFWLLPNESITLSERGFVFSLITVHRGATVIDVNLSGKTHRIKPGDFVEFETADSICKVFYKVAHPREDKRYGFDLVCDAKQ